MNEQNSGWYVEQTFEDGSVGRVWAEDAEDAKRIRKNVIRRKGVVSAEVGFEAAVEIDPEAADYMETAEGKAWAEEAEIFCADQAAIDEGFFETEPEVEAGSDADLDEIEEAIEAIETEEVAASDEEDGAGEITETRWATFRVIAGLLGCRYQQVWQRMKQGRLVADHVGPKGVWAARWDSVEEWIAVRNQYFSWREARMGQVTLVVGDGDEEKTVIFSQAEAEDVE